MRDVIISYDFDDSIKVSNKKYRCLKSEDFECFWSDEMDTQDHWTLRFTSLESLFTVRRVIQFFRLVRIQSTTQHCRECHIEP